MLRTRYFGIKKNELRCNKKQAFNLGEKKARPGFLKYNRPARLSELPQKIKTLITNTCQNRDWQKDDRIWTINYRIFISLKSWSEKVNENVAHISAVIGSIANHSNITLCITKGRPLLAMDFSIFRPRRKASTSTGRWCACMGLVKLLTPFSENVRSHTARLVYYELAVGKNVKNLTWLKSCLSIFKNSQDVLHTIVAVRVLFWSKASSPNAPPSDISPNNCTVKCSYVSESNLKQTNGVIIYIVIY